MGRWRRVSPTRVLVALALLAYLAVFWSCVAKAMVKVL